MRPARIAAVKTLSPRFRLIDLEGEALRKIAWSPGQKLQISMESSFNTRTYTPMMWDADAGRSQILAFSHGEGPGSRWASSVREGDTCMVFGPRRSLDLTSVASPTVLFGDETSFGVAAALRNGATTDNSVRVFEVSDVAESRAVLAAVGLDRTTLVERLAEDTHLPAIEAEVTRLAADSAHFVLTGKAPSIQRVNRALKAAGVSSSRLKNRAYWAPGKSGMD